MGTLAGKKILVTGGGQGLGAAMVEALGEAGGSVAIHFHSSRKGAELLRDAILKKGGKAEVFQANLCEETEATRLVLEAARFLGGIDVLVNNAGDLVQRSSLAEMPTELWERIYRVNVTSLMWVSRAAVSWLEQAKGGASIVNLASLAGRKGGHAGSLAYASAKGAVLTMTRMMATELGPKGIRVNAVAPGLILGTRFHDTHTTTESAEATVKGIPLGRAGTPEDVARAVVFLASEYDGFIHGTTLDINGGVYSV